MTINIKDGTNNIYNVEDKDPYIFIFFDKESKSKSSVGANGALVDVGFMITQLLLYAYKASNKNIEFMNSTWLYFQEIKDKEYEMKRDIRSGCIIKESKKDV